MKSKLLFVFYYHFLTVSIYSSITFMHKCLIWLTLKNNQQFIDSFCILVLLPDKSCRHELIERSIWDIKYKLHCWKYLDVKNIATWNACLQRGKNNKIIIYTANYFTYIFDISIKPKILFCFYDNCAVFKTCEQPNNIVPSDKRKV